MTGRPAKNPPTVRTCRKCGETKGAEEFVKLGEGRRNTCKACWTKRATAAYAAKRGSDYSAQMIDDAPEGMKTCRRCSKVYPNTIEFFHQDKRYRTTQSYCKPCWNELHRKWTHQLRVEVLKHYGGDPPKCACCGEARIEFLSMDHENNDGAQHRQEIKASGARTIYSWIKKHGYPVGFRVLCHNCNLSRGFYGYCPHEKERELRNLVHIVKDETGKERNQ